MEENEVVNPIVKIDAFNKTNKKSLVNMVDKEGYLYERMQAVTDEVLKFRGEPEFRYLLGKNPNFSTIRRLRLQFWNVYNQAINAPRQDSKMLLSACYSGICSQPFYKKLMNNDVIAAFVFTQPHDVKMIQKDILYEGYKYLEEIMMLPVTKPDGSPNDKIISHKIKIVQMMEDRLNGSVVQRSQGFLETIPSGDDKVDPEQIKNLREEVARLKKGLGKEIEEAVFKDVKVEQ